MNCSYCGAQLQPNAVFCRHCGAKAPVQNNYQTDEDATRLIVDYEPAEQNVYQGQQTVQLSSGMWDEQPARNTEQKKNNTGLIVAVVVLSVIIVVGIAVLLGYMLGNNNDDNSVPVTETEGITQTVEQVIQPVVESTTVPTTAAQTKAPETTAPTVTQSQTIPTFTYNDNNTSSSQFLFDSANQYITRSYLSGCTRDEITIIINEIYARHGYIFKDAELREYFNSQSWYHGTISSMDEAARYFNDIEQSNINTIYQYQKDMGWRE